MVRSGESTFHSMGVGREGEGGRGARGEQEGRGGGGGGRYRWVRVVFGERLEVIRRIGTAVYHSLYVKGGVI